MSIQQSPAIKLTPLYPLYPLEKDPKGTKLYSPLENLGLLFSSKYEKKGLKWPNILQWSAVRVTPLGIGKSVTVTDCHSNSSYKMTHI